MGVVTGIASAALAIGSSLYGKKQEKKQARQAEAAQREAALHNVQVGRSGDAPTQSTEDAAQINAANNMSAAKRKKGLASTIRGAGLVSSTLGGKSKLGG